MNTGERGPGPGGRRSAKQDGQAGEPDGRARGRRHAGSKTSSQGRRGARESPPQSVDEALARALRHGRNALAESLLAGRALLDAASLAVSGRPVATGEDQAAAGDAARALGGVADAIDGLARRLRADPQDAGLHLVHALLEALDVEIGRWEERARQDPDARAVLRAFLGLRELLWELGMRPTAAPSAPEPTTPKSDRRAKGRSEPVDRARSPAPSTGPGGPQNTARTAGPRRRRVQRIEIER